jgi:pimeloyl-ACP methyl ester carboxylesterase
MMVRNRTIVGIAGGVVAGILALPALLLARKLQAKAFNPVQDRKGRGALDLQVTAISDQTVTLRKASKAPVIAPDATGRYLLEGARGWSTVGRVIDSNDILAIREIERGGGEIRAGDYARLDAYAYPGDPLQAHGIPFEDVRFTSELGEFPAWYVAGASHTWAILTHGKGADRRETLRILPALVDSGFHCLAITYRNDEGLPVAARHSYSYGRDEWQDLDGAVAYALEHGASDIVLVGYSMGGAITLSFMANSENAGAVSALILDAPMTHLEETVAHGAKLAGLPVRMLSVSNRVAARVHRYRWSDFDYFKNLDGLQAPVLLFHGDEDRVIPVDLSDRMAELRPDIVRYVRVAGADHVRAWNVDPQRYLATVRDFVKTRRSVETG